MGLRFVEMGTRWAHKMLPSIRFTNYAEQEKNDTWPFNGRVEFVWNEEISETPAFRIAWKFGTSGVGLTFRVNPDRDSAAVHVSMPLVSLWFGIKHGSIYRIAPEDRQVSAAFRDGSVFWKLWTDPNCWSSTTPRWRDGSVSIVDALLGPVEITSQIVDSRITTIPMPEGAYKVRTIIERRTHARLRWFAWTSLRGSAETGDDITMPIPVPGKGENGHDCDEDALHAMSVDGIRTHADIVGEVVRSVLSTRERRAGIDWRPTRGPYGSNPAGNAPPVKTDAMYEKHCGCVPPSVDPSGFMSPTVGQI
jgi:hypothetical protein